MLILDLDNTIFETKSMDSKIFDSAFALIEKYYTDNKLGIKSEEIITDLWSIPVDVVFAKYNTPTDLVSAFYKQIEEIDYEELDIKTYDDYIEIQKLKDIKILVTTGFKELQLAKIKALGIESDFDEIHIDDPRLNPRNHKIDIFRQILMNTKKKPEEIWVIGDNPESEIQSGKKLGMKTIQRKSINMKSSEFADYEIDTFNELKEILN